MGYIAKWRRPYRKRHTLRRPPLTEEALRNRAERRVTYTIRGALRGDTESFERLLKLMDGIKEGG